MTYSKIVNKPLQIKEEYQFKDLTRKFIKPNLGLILQDIKRIRRLVDEVLSGQDTGNSDKYPIGCCLEIRGAVIDLIEEKYGDKSYPGIQAIAQFCEAGGEINTPWCIDSDKNIFKT